MSTRPHSKQPAGKHGNTAHRDHAPDISRRFFLGSSMVCVAFACATPFIGSQGRRRFSGSIVGGNSSLGHAARDRQFPPPSETVETAIVIIGGGIAGLAAARRLAAKGFTDFRLLELEAWPGGNAVSGQNSVSAFPWAAHYVPIAATESVEVTRLFEELGVIEGRDSEGLPIYQAEYLCGDPMERLLIHGRWQEGFVPQTGLTAIEQQAIDSFFAEMHRLKSLRGRDGRRAFAIPIDESSRDEEFIRLDGITMADYLAKNGWLQSAPLRWYVDYCCRDDYGAGLEKVSAWAGVHYFASRDGRAANAPGYAVVAWPEGNGWFVRRMLSAIGPRVDCSSAVWNVETEGNRLLVDYFDAGRQKSVRIHARGVVWSAPDFVVRRVIRELREQPSGGAPAVYSPWVVANLTLDSMPGGPGMELAWDNICYAAKSLGYVVATHQTPHPVPKRTVITYYRPLDDDEPANARQKALAASYDDWCDLIVDDLSQPHPDIARHVTRLDVWLWGHAMVRPVPGFIWGPGRARMQEPLGNLVFAHSDRSGIAIFEEAYTRGVRAADRLLEQLNFSPSAT